jgi:hypothetical protein
MTTKRPMSTYQPTLAAPTTTRQSAPSWGWAMRRASFGLALMLGVTALAAYLAYASIDPVIAEPEAAAPSINIGTPASALLKNRRSAANEP